MGTFSVGRNVAVPGLADSANRYAAERGLSRRADYSGVVVNPAHARRIAAAYADAPSYDPTATPHFKAMAEETGRQFDFMTKPKRRGGMGISVDVTHEDPYANASGLFNDLQRNRHLSVLSTAATGAHPFFTNDQNDMFRAVHDTFGHAATGRGFDRHGEEAAFQSHAAMFSPEARPAMAAETRGQNAALNYGPEPGTFQEQKVARIAPAERNSIFTNAAEQHKAQTQARFFHAQAFGG